jgi:hypothetical protein
MVEVDRLMIEDYGIPALFSGDAILKVLSGQR